MNIVVSPPAPRVATDHWPSARMAAVRVARRLRAVPRGPARTPNSSVVARSTMRPPWG